MAKEIGIAIGGGAAGAILYLATFIGGHPEWGWGAQIIGSHDGKQVVYDAAQKKVVANREIPLPKSIPVMSFGEDENGEVYFTTYSAEGQGVFRIQKAE